MKSPPLALPSEKQLQRIAQKYGLRFREWDVSSLNKTLLVKRLSIPLASTAGLRNRLVHRYEDMEHKIVYHGAVRLLATYRRYIKLVHKYLQSAN